ncbi:MAG TPA: DUF4397 domain-containing protein [Terriglobales bacterium]|nr:DUF4397 domain-containing protein [Terriglobales bacterium]
MYRLLGVLAFVIVITATGLLGAGCGASHNTAQLRVVQAIPNAPDSLNVSVNGKNAFTDLSFGNAAPVSGYQSTSAGSDQLAVSLTGSTTPLINGKTLSLASTSQSTLLLTGLYASATEITILDNNTAPLPGQVELRVIDASPSAPGSLDVYMAAPGTDITQLAPVTSGLQFGQASIYVPFNTVSSTDLARIMVIVTPAGSKTQLLNQIYTPYDGQIRSLVLVDNPPPNGGTMSYVPIELNDLN